MKNLNGPEYPSFSGNNNNLICFLHGYGADGFDLLPLAKNYGEYFKDTYFISPNAPYELELSNFGKQWFSLEDRMPEKLLQGARNAALYLDNYFEHTLRKLDLSYEKLFIIGFSQGAMLALYYMLTRNNNLGGIISFSGALITPPLSEMNPGIKTPVCLIHGTNDEVVPFESMNNATENLRKIGIKYQNYKCIGLGHGINSEAIDKSMSFLKELIK